MSKDFSFVVWSTGEEVEITAEFAETTVNRRDGWPLIERLTDDMNAENESGADLCFKTP